MYYETDETIGRIADALRPLPDVDRAEKVRVLVAAVWLSGSRAAPVEAVAVAPAPADAGSASARLAGDAKGLKTVQMVLRAPGAQHVSVVGEFNGWDPAADVMTRDPVSGLWSHSLALRPGRHVYAFVVDDTVWMRDPRGLEAADADFGRPGSVLLVGQP